MKKEVHDPKSVVRTLSSQFLFTALLFVLLHHSREIVGLERSREAINYIPGQSFYELLSPVFFDFVLLGAGLSIALLVVRFFGHALLVQRVTASILLTLTLFGALCVLFEAKTGDWLTLQVLAFGISNAKEVAALIAHEIPLWQWGIVLLTTVVLAISLFCADRIGRRFLAALCGFGLMAIASNGIGQDNGEEIPYFTRTLQIGWLNEQSPVWHGSIILASLGYGEGESSRLNARSPLRDYSNPQFVSQSGSRPNIVLIVLESVRSSVTSVYSTDARFKAITPNLEKLAHQGIVVDHAYTTVPHTSKALVGIFCGQFPRKELSILEATPDGLPINCLPRLMGRAGYQTAYFQSAEGTYENRQGLLSNMGFGYTRTRDQLPRGNFAMVGYFGADDNIMVKPAVDWMKSSKSKGQPFFVGMLTVVSHHPYARPHETPDISTPEKAYRAYESSVQSTDRFVGELIATMRKEGLMENTLVIITGDHGEGFGEHGPRMHNGTAYEEGIRVPLILYGPKIIKGSRRISGLRQHIDLMPTIVELTGIQLNQHLPGLSLFESEGHDQVVMQCWYENYCVASVTATGNKLIYWYGKRPLESFNLNIDTKESKNLGVGWSKEQRGEKVQAIFQQLADLRSVYK